MTSPHLDRFLNEALATERESDAGLKVRTC